MSTVLPYRILLVVMLAICGGISSLSAQSITWQFVGRGEGGDIAGFYQIGPNDIITQEMSHGFYRSTDGGEHWKPFLRDSLYAFFGGGNGQPLFIRKSPGIDCFSTDNGVSWIPLSSLPSNEGIVADAEGRLFSSRSGVIFRSLDHGISWSNIRYTRVGKKAYYINGPRGSLYAVFCDGLTYASSGTGNLITRTTDGGETWTDLPLQGLPFDLSTFAIAPDGTMYAGCVYSGVYRSTDDGATWPIVLSCQYVSGIIATSRDIAVIGGEGLHFSSDRGENWEHRTDLSPTTIYGGLIDTTTGSILLGVESFGVLRLSDRHAQPRPSNTGIDAMGMQRLWIAPEGALMALSGTAVLRSTDQGDHWQRLARNDALAAFSIVSSGGTMITIVGLQNGAAIIRSVDGTTWDTVYSAAVSLGNLTVGPDHDLYATMTPDRIIRSTDDGLTWRNFALASSDSDGRYYALYVDGDRLLAGTSMGYIVEYLLSTKKEIARHRVPQGVENIQKAPDGTFFTLSWLGGVMRSTDHCVTWVPAQPDIDPSNREFSQLFIDRYGNLFLDMDLGIFFSADGGRSWTLENTGLPPVDSFNHEGPLYYITRGASNVVYAANSAGLYRGTLAGGAGVKTQHNESTAFPAGQLFPNPTSGNTVLHLQLDEGGVVNVRVADLVGRDLLSVGPTAFEAGGHDLPIDLSKLTAGVYICSVDCGSMSKAMRLMIVR